MLVSAMGNDAGIHFRETRRWGAGIFFVVAVGSALRIFGRKAAEKCVAWNCGMRRWDLRQREMANREMRCGAMPKMILEYDLGV